MDKKEARQCRENKEEREVGTDQKPLFSKSLRSMATSFGLRDIFDESRQAPMSASQIYRFRGHSVSGLRKATFGKVKSEKRSEFAAMVNRLSYKDVSHCWLLTAQS